MGIRRSHGSRNHKTKQFLFTAQVMVSLLLVTSAATTGAMVAGASKAWGRMETSPKQQVLGFILHFRGVDKIKMEISYHYSSLFRKGFL